MSVIVVGLDQHSTGLDLLERVAVAEDGLPKALADLRTRVPLSEVVVVSTCLRTELYAVVDRFHEGVERLHEYLADRASCSVDELMNSVRVLFDDAVTTHVFEVAAGLRSAVIGETEVLGQVRRAIDVAERERAAGPVLTSLFRRAVQVGRRVRTTTAIARGTTSLSHVAVELAEACLGTLAGRSIVVVGAGEMGESMVGALHNRAPGARIAVANRTREKAKALAEQVDGVAVGLDRLPEVLVDAEAVLVSTASTVPVLDASHLAAPAAARAAEGSELVVVDLSVPRNVDHAVKGLPGLALFDMDDLRGQAERAIDDRRAELATAQAIVAEEVERFRAYGRARGAAPVVSALRTKIEELRDAELRRHRKRLASLDEQQWAEVQSVVTDVVAKLLHEPSVALKDAAGTPRGERLVEALRSLFDL